MLQTRTDVKAVPCERCRIIRSFIMFVIMLVLLALVAGDKLAYLNFLNADQTAQFKDNTKHLRGASMRILRDRPTPAIKILKGSTLLILSESSTNLIEEGSREILNGFIEWKKNKPAEKVKETLQGTLNFIKSNVGNKFVKDELIRIQENFDLLYYSSWTNDFKDGFLTNYPKT